MTSRTEASHERFCAALRAMTACAALGAMAAAQAEKPATSATPESTGKARQETTAVFRLRPANTEISAASLVAGFYYPRAFCPEPKFGDELNVPDVRLLYTPGVPPFAADPWASVLSAADLPLKQTDNFIDRLAALEQLELLPLLRTESATVYFGVNRQGMLGMHLDSRD